MCVSRFSFYSSSLNLKFHCLSLKSQSFIFIFTCNYHSNIHIYVKSCKPLISPWLSLIPQSLIFTFNRNLYFKHSFLRKVFPHSASLVTLYHHYSVITFIQQFIFSLSRSSWVYTKPGRDHNIHQPARETETGHPVTLVAPSGFPNHFGGCLPPSSWLEANETHTWVKPRRYDSRGGPKQRQYAVEVSEIDGCVCKESSRGI